jgi:hypothetical protein
MHARCWLCVFLLSAQSTVSTFISRYILVLHASLLLCVAHDVHWRRRDLPACCASQVCAAVPVTDQKLHVGCNQPQLVEGYLNIIIQCWMSRVEGCGMPCWRASCGHVLPGVWRR